MSESDNPKTVLVEITFGKITGVMKNEEPKIAITVQITDFPVSLIYQLPLSLL